MEAMLMKIGEHVWAQSWQIAVLASLVGLVTWCLRNQSSHVRYLLWLIVLAKCVVPPLHAVRLPLLPQVAAVMSAWSGPAEVRTEPVAARRVEALAGGPPETRPASAMPPAGPTTASSSQVTRWGRSAYLTLVWMAGLCVFALAAAAKAIRTATRLRHGRVALPTALGSEVDEDLATFGTRDPPKFWLFSGVGQPFVWGLVRGAVYLPADFAEIGDRQMRRNLIAHETCHVVRRDPAVNAVQVIVQAAFWFHPLVWWANKRIRAEREKCCDEMAVARLGTQAKDYSTAILNVLVCEQQSNQPVPSLAVAGPVNNIEERIKSMLRPGRRFYPRPSLGAAILVLSIGLATLPTAFVLTARAQTQPAVQDVANAPVPTARAQTQPAVQDVNKPAATDGKQEQPRYAARTFNSELPLHVLVTETPEGPTNRVGDTPMQLRCRSLPAGTG